MITMGRLGTIVGLVLAIGGIAHGQRAASDGRGRGSGAAPGTTSSGTAPAARTRPAPATATPSGASRGVPAAGTPAAAAPSVSSANIQVTYLEQTEFMLRRDQLDALAKQMGSSTPAAPQKKGGLLGGIGNRLKETVGGDDHREEAATQMVKTQAAALSANGAKTVVAVIGTEADRDKVKDSLADVQRQVIVMFVNAGFKNETYDNSSLRSGFFDKATGAATNLWVFLPRAGSSAVQEPSQTLSTKVVSPSIWTGIFGSDGDLPPAANDLVTGQPPAPAAKGTRPPGPASLAPAAVPPAPASAPATSGGLAEGDVVVPKIANIKLLAMPADDGKVVATLAKTDELVVTGPEKNGYVNVQGSSASGWVKAVLVVKH